MRLGIDIGGTKMEAAILDDGGVFVFRERLETPSSYRELLKDIAKLVDKAKSVTGYDGPVGVCTPGIVTSENLIEGGNLQIIIVYGAVRIWMNGLMDCIIMIMNWIVNIVMYLLITILVDINLKT